MTLIQSEYNEQASRIKRVSTGVPGLDEKIQGGFPQGSITLLSGPPGSGKSILCGQYLHQGVEDGDKCLFLTLDKKVEGLLSQTDELGMDFQPAIDSGQIKFLFLNINKKLIYETMTNEILSGDYQRIVLDSITPISEMPIYIKNHEITDNINIIDPDEFSTTSNFPTRRLHLHYIMNALETSNCTSLVTSELPTNSTNLSRDGLSEFLADAVIVLNYDSTMDRRKLSIMKMRSTKHTLKPQNIEIGYGGLKIV